MNHLMTLFILILASALSPTVSTLAQSGPIDSDKTNGTPEKSRLITSAKLMIAFIAARSRRIPTTRGSRR